MPHKPAGAPQLAAGEQQRPQRPLAPPPPPQQQQQLPGAAAAGPPGSGGTGSSSGVSYASVDDFSSRVEIYRGRHSVVWNVVCKATRRPLILKAYMKVGPGSRGVGGGEVAPQAPLGVLLWHCSSRPASIRRPCGESRSPSATRSLPACILSAPTPDAFLSPR